MLPKDKRLNLKKDYRFVTAGRRVVLPDFTLFHRSVDAEDVLVGIALSKSQFDRASKRNKARRRISKAVEGIYPFLRKGIKLVIIPKTSVLDRKPEELKSEFENVKDIFESN